MAVWFQRGIWYRHGGKLKTSRLGNKNLTGEEGSGIWLNPFPYTKQAMSPVSTELIIEDEMQFAHGSQIKMFDEEDVNSIGFSYAISRQYYAFSFIIIISHIQGGASLR